MGNLFSELIAARAAAQDFVEAAAALRASFERGRDLDDFARRRLQDMIGAAERLDGLPGGVTELFAAAGQEQSLLGGVRKCARAMKPTLRALLSGRTVPEDAVRRLVESLGLFREGLHEEIGREQRRVWRGVVARPPAEEATGSGSDLREDMESRAIAWLYRDESRASMTLKESAREIGCSDRHLRRLSRFRRMRDAIRDAAGGELPRGGVEGGKLEAWE